MFPLRKLFGCPFGSFTTSLLAGLCLCAATITASLTGCGYHSVGTATHIPAAVHTIDVPIFKNRTQAYHTEITMTHAVLKELESRTAWRAVSTDDPGTADAVLHGDITSYSVYPLTYDSTTNQSSSYEVTIVARVKLTDRSGHVLFQNNNYLFRQQYESTQDLASFIQEDSAAVHRLSRDFAQALVADMTESF